MSNIVAALKDFFHSVTTRDHYATYDPDRSAARDAARVPLALDGGRHGRLQDATPKSSDSDETLRGNAAEIPLSDISDAAPAPALSWERADVWIETEYPELFDQLLDPATENDLDELERDLDCRLPADVRESYLIHDGQESGGKPTGVFFGISLLNLESVYEEWNIWRNTALRIEELNNRPRPSGSNPIPSHLAPTPSSSRVSPQPAGPPPRPQPSQAMQTLAANQRSVPPDAVQPVYANPGWIPLAKDYDGNNIGVDLVPGPKGHYGQVILFGRDFDTKYVVAPSWARFLAMWVADLESNSFYINEDIEDAVFAYKLPNGRLANYFDVLRGRAERKFRRPKQSGPGNPHVQRRGGPPPNRLRTLRSTAAATDTVIRLSPQKPSSPLKKSDPSSPAASSSLADDLKDVSLDDSNQSTRVPHELKEVKFVISDAEDENDAREPEPQLKPETQSETQRPATEQTEQRLETESHE